MDGLKGFTKTRGTAVMEGTTIANSMEKAAVIQESVDEELYGLKERVDYLTHLQVLGAHLEALSGTSLSREKLEALDIKTFLEMCMSDGDSFEIHFERPDLDWKFGRT